MVVGRFRGIDPLEGFLYYMGHGWLGPIAALLVVAVGQIGSRTFTGGWLERPGRWAWKIAVAIGVLVLLEDIRSVFV
jgi:hypothetical protein